MSCYINLIFQLSIVAKDISSSPKSAVARLIVNVVRNQNAPIFDSSSYSANASDVTPVGTIIANVSASDPDANNQYNAGVRYLCLVSFTIVDSAKCNTCG